MRACVWKFAPLMTAMGNVRSVCRGGSAIVADVALALLAVVGVIVSAVVVAIVAAVAV